MATTRIQSGGVTAQSITHDKLHTDMNLSTKTVVLPSLSQTLVTAITHSNGAVAEGLKLTTNGSYSSSNSEEAGPAISFGQFNSSYPTWKTGQISGIRDGNNWNGSLGFWTNNGSSETDITEKVRITGAGKVGIGTHTPDALLHIVGSDNNNLTVQNSTYQNSGQNTEAAIRFKVTASSDDERAKAGILLKNDGSAYGRGDLHFLVDSSDDNGNAVLADSKMVISHEGNVGIGTDDPKRPLQIGATGSFPISFNGNYPDIHFNTYYEGGWRIHTAGFGAKTTFNGATGAFGFSNVASTQTAGANFTPQERLTILANGNVGIGNASPTSLLSVGEIPTHVPGTAFTSSPSVFYSTTTLGNTTGNDQKIATFAGEDGSNVSGLAVYRYRRATGTNWTTDGFSLRQEVDASENLYNYMNFAGGNVGIGTALPGYKLEVAGTAHVSNTLSAGSLTIPSQGLIFNQAFGTGVPSITMTGTANNGRGGAINFKESDGAGGAISNTAAIYSTDGVGGNVSYGGLTLAAYQSDIRFATATLAGTKAIIKADGKVGIGVTDPATKLEVSGAVQDIETAISNSSSNQWSKIGTVFGLYQGGANIHIQFKMHSGYNASNFQDYNVELFMKTSNGSSANGSGGSLMNSWWYKTGNSGASPRFKWKDIGTNNYELFMWVPAFAGNSSYTVKKSAGRWFPDGAINQSDPGADSSTVLEAEDRLGIYSNTIFNGTLKVASTGGFYNNGVREYSQYIDNLINNANVNFDVPVTRTGSGYTVYYECMYNHFGNTSYGSWRSGFFSFRSDNNNTYYDDVIKNHGSSSTGGGGWTVTLIGANTATPYIRFNKNAGQYVGSGDGHIFVRGGAL